jgi:E3 ubiquitin-protein ligase HECTD2
VSQSEGNREYPAAYVPRYHFEEQPTLRPNPLRGNTPSRSYSASYPERPPIRQLLPASDRPKNNGANTPGDVEDPKRLFKPLEDYIVTCFASFQAVNSSFSTRRPGIGRRSGSESIRRRPTVPKRDSIANESPICHVDAKLLLLGDFAENGAWWSGGQDDVRPRRSSSHRADDQPSYVNPRSPLMDWSELEQWYSTIINAAEPWTTVYNDLLKDDVCGTASDTDFPELEGQILKAQEHTQRILLKATELLLKRPGRLMADPENARFLLIVLENPLLHANPTFFQGKLQADSTSAKGKINTHPDSGRPSTGPISGQHSSIIKRIIGLISNSASEFHHPLIGWFARYPLDRFMRVKDLVGGFLTYRLLRQNEKKHEVKVDVTDWLIPSMSTGRSVAALHAAVGTSRSLKKPTEMSRQMIYNDDWQIKAAARVLAILFAANNIRNAWRGDVLVLSGDDSAAEQHPISHGDYRGLPTSDFYNSLLDNADLVADFGAWESRRRKFAFCQYPFLLSIWAKIQILEHEAQRQMQSKARDAFFDSIMSRKKVDQYLVLDVRRDCLVEDSLQAVGEVIGSGTEDVKKGLRISFRGEEGVDAGGLRKEWFLLLVREIFNPDHGKLTRCKVRSLRAELLTLARHVRLR